MAVFRINGLPPATGDLTFYQIMATNSKSESINDRGARMITCPDCNQMCRATSNLCPKCSYVFSGADRRHLVTGAVSKQQSRRKSVEESVFVREMAALGFKYIRHFDGLTGEQVKCEDDAQIKKLGLEFGPLPSIAEDVHITQTSPQVQISMSMEKFLELAGITP